MPEAINIGVKVDLRDAEQLKDLPKSVREQWEEVNRVFKNTEQMTGALGERFRRVSESVATLTGRAEERGGFLDRERRDVLKATVDAKRLLTQYYDEQIAIVKTKGSQLDQEIAALADRLSRAKYGSPEHSHLQHELSRKQAAREHGGDAAQGELESLKRARREASNLFKELANWSKLAPDFKMAQLETSGWGGQFVKGPTGWGSQFGGTAFAPGMAPGPQQLHPGGWGGQFMPNPWAAQFVPQGTIPRFNPKFMPPGPPGPPDGPSGGVPWWVGGATAGGKFLRGIAGAYSLYALGGFARRHFGEELGRGTTVADLAQQLKPEDMPYGEFRERISNLHPSLKPEEATRFVAAFGGRAGRSGALLSSREAAGLTRGFGFTPEQGAALFGQAGQLGLTTENGQKRFAEMLAEAIATGRMKGREAEAFESMIRLGETLVARVGTASGFENIATLMGRFGETNTPGLKGRYGAQLLEGVDQSLVGIGQRLFQMPDLATPVALQVAADMGLTPAETRKRFQRGIGDPELLARYLQTGERLYQGAPELQQQFLEQTGIPPELQDEAARILQNPRKLDALTKLRQLVGQPELSRIPLEKLGGVAEIAQKVGRPDFTREHALKELSALRMEDRPEARMREDVAELQQELAGVVRELIPAFRELLGVITEFTGGLGTVRGWIRGRLEDVGMSKEAAGPVSSIMTASPFVYAGYKALQAGKRLLFGGGAHAETAAQVAAYARTVPLWRAVGAGGLGAVSEWVWPQSTAGPDDTMLTEEELRGGHRRYLGERLTGKEIQQLTALGARESGLSQELIRRVMRQESNFDPNAVSRKGAIGLMQLMPSSFPHLSREDMLDPVKNVTVGSTYLRQMMNQYGGDPRKGLSAYNAGPGRLDTILSSFGADWFSHLPKETRNYVNKITEGQSSPIMIEFAPLDINVTAGEKQTHHVMPRVRGQHYLSTTSPLGR